MEAVEILFSCLFRKSSLLNNTCLRIDMELISPAVVWNNSKKLLISCPVDSVTACYLGGIETQWGDCKRHKGYEVGNNIYLT